MARRESWEGAEGAEYKAGTIQNIITRRGSMTRPRKEGSKDGVHKQKVGDGNALQGSEVCYRIKGR